MEQFAQKRIEYVIKEFRKDNEELKTWVIMRKAGIKDWNLWQETIKEIIRSRR